MKLESSEIIKKVGEEGYKYLGIIERDYMKEHEANEMYTNEYLRKTRFVLQWKLNGRCKIRAINRWAVALMRYATEIIF